MNGIPGLGWFGIVRLGTVQMALGAIFVLMTSLINRVIAVELALPAAFAGSLLAIHYAMQMLRPHFGHGSDAGGQRTPWIIGGMLVLAGGAILATAATAVMAEHTLAGMGLAVFSFVLVGAGVGAGGTSLLVLIAAKVAPQRRAAAACITWVMMIAGFIITTATAEQLLTPFSFTRLLNVVIIIATVAFLVSVIAVWGIERKAKDVECSATEETGKTPFLQALRQVLDEPATRLFSVFIAISMFAYGLQDLVLEPFGGAVFGMTPAESTGLSKQHNMGVLLGMLGLGIIGSHSTSALRHGTVVGCFASTVTLVLLVLTPTPMAIAPVTVTVFALGLANGIFAVAAVGNMMHLVSEGNAGRQGVRMGVWGSAQAIAMGLGAIAGTIIVDVMRLLAADVTVAYSSVFSAQAALFFIAALIALGLRKRTAEDTRPLSMSGVSLESLHDQL
ncbi:MAG: BCD family MFS transporter [Pseudomonadota bacterium]